MSGLPVGVGAQLAVAVLGLSLTAGACTSTSVDEEREAHIYTEVVRWIVANDPGGMEPDGPLFVESRGPADIAVEVQAAVVRLLEEHESVRFIDTREEAVDDSAPDGAVRDGGLLVSLGPVPEGSSVEIEAVRYRSEEERSGYLLTVRRRNGVWSVTGVPSAVQLEG